MNLAFHNGKVASDIAWRRVKPFRNVEHARIRYLTVAEARRLINACDAEFRPLVQAALATGARYAELARLEACDFNPDSGTVAIRQSKSGKPRHVILTDEGATLFRRMTAGRPGTSLIFPRTDGTPWGAAHQVRRMADASARAKLTPTASFHALRHSWAT